MLAAYLAASAVLESPGARPVFLHVRSSDGDIGLPLLLRPLPDGRGWDATSPYGYGGPVSRTAQDGTALGQALDEWARGNGVVCIFLRLHPLLDAARLVPPTADLVELGSTVAWDVTAGRDLMSHMHPHHRRAARRAAEAGLEVTVRIHPTSLDAFRKLYESTMRRQDASPFFFFPDASGGCARPQRRAGARARRGTARRRTRRLPSLLHEGAVAALPPGRLGRPRPAHRGIGASGHRGIGASGRCFLTAAEWAQWQGMTGFHLGGGVGGSSESSLFDFKHRFDPAGVHLPFRVAKLVHDPDRYLELAGTASTSGFFPPWRRSG
jgi:serine/alanine adding enzyme